MLTCPFLFPVRFPLMQSSTSSPLYTNAMFSFTAATTTNVANASLITSAQQATTPPSYVTPIASTSVTSMPEPSQRPSVVVPVPPVQSTPSAPAVSAISKESASSGGKRSELLFLNAGSLTNLCDCYYICV